MCESPEDREDIEVLELRKQLQRLDSDYDRADVPDQKTEG